MITASKAEALRARWHELTGEQQLYWQARGVEPVPSPPLLVIKPEGRAGIPGRYGLSHEAVRLFDLAQAAGGELRLDDERVRLHPNNWAQLVRELEPHGLVERFEAPRRLSAYGGSDPPCQAFRIPERFAAAMVVSGGWSRYG